MDANTLLGLPGMLPDDGTDLTQGTNLGEVVSITNCTWANQTLIYVCDKSFNNDYWVYSKLVCTNSSWE